jgi:hypothetical protein
MKNGDDLKQAADRAQRRSDVLLDATVLIWGDKR